MSRPMIDSTIASIRLGNTSSNPDSRSRPRSIGVFCRSAQFWATAASASSPKRRLDRDLDDVDPRSALRDRQQQADALRVEHEHERHQERRQRVFPRLQRGPVGIAAGDGGGRERRQRGRRRHLRQHGVIEDEHVRGVIGHAELDQRGRGDHRADDVGRRHRHREADDPDDQRGIDRGQQQAAAGIGDHDRREFEAEPGQRHDADDDAGAGAGGRGVERADRAVGQRLHQLASAPARFPCAGSSARR